MIFICQVIICAITALSGYPHLDSYADSTIHDVRWCLMKADSQREVYHTEGYIVSSQGKNEDFMQQSREVAERVVMCQRYQRPRAQHTLPLPLRHHLPNPPNALLWPTLLTSPAGGGTRDSGPSTPSPSAYSSLQSPCPVTRKEKHLYNSSTQPRRASCADQ